MSTLKIVLLSNWNSVHTRRWAEGLSRRGHNVTVVTQASNFPHGNNIQVIKLRLKGYLGYYLNSISLRKLLRKVRPDLLHAHFASGFGTLGRLSRWRPYVLSTWGSDVYEFPERSNFHRRLVTKNILAADWICSTSFTMGERVKEVSGRVSNISITPFGIDTKMFFPRNEKQGSSDIYVGIVKRLSDDAGVDILIDSFKIVLDHLSISQPSLAGRLRLAIIGDGPEKGRLQSLASKLGIGGRVQFYGPIIHSDIPQYLHSLDIYCALSRAESFGVAALEASSCGLPVVATRLPGLLETQRENKTALFVNQGDASGAARAIAELVVSPVLRDRLGKAGRQNVISNFDWDKSLDTMERTYLTVLSKHKSFL